MAVYVAALSAISWLSVFLIREDDLAQGSRDMGLAVNGEPNPSPTVRTSTSTTEGELL